MDDKPMAISEPRPLPRRWGWTTLDGSDRLGMERLSGWFVPSYARSPFLAFLRAAPDEAIDMIVRITEAATERWAQEQAVEATSEPSEEPYPVAFEDALTITLVDGDTTFTRRGDSGGVALAPPTRPTVIRPRTPLKATRVRRASRGWTAIATGAHCLAPRRSAGSPSSARRAP